MRELRGINLQGGSSINAHSIAAGDNATAISGPERAATPSESGPDGRRESTRSVFVVHGRDEAARRAVFDLIRRMGLEPLEWETLVNRTRSASPYLEDPIREGFAIAQAILILMTPDDIVELHPDLHDNDHTGEGLHCQARPNVLFEAGMAMALNPQRTVIVHIGRMRPVSDLEGRNYIHLNGTPNSIIKLRNRLKTAGCDVNDTAVDFIDGSAVQALPTHRRGARH
ncbi:TIR domain-containing protein [Herbidospora cretacea]|uniref:TIR domain-containing protein n=1 Tax=Herbidospora cretacea TaxID=28444 RepID=UPI0009DE6F22|nr:nucleotide-binding protein [Herbidospora cretacea]